MELPVEIVQLLASPAHRYDGRPKDGPAPFEGVETHDEVEVRAGLGIVGDRFFGRPAHRQAAVTLFAIEALDAVAAQLGVELDVSRTRRNIILRGFPVDDLRGHTFTLDGVRFRAHRPANPCAWMDEQLAPGAFRALRKREGCAASLSATGSSDWATRSSQSKLRETEAMPSESITVAVIGGSGLYSLFDPAESEQRDIETPYGLARVTIGTLAGRRTAFLTRHGVDHSVAPHLINFRANIWALASLGVKAIVSSSAVGGVHPDYPPGTLVLTDQYIDRTHGRADTFYTEGSVQHLASADPFCPTLLAIARDVVPDVTPSGTVVVIQGPRFSTRAESLWFRSAGAHTINMTMYPEVALASELNIGTANLSFVTDSDAGLAPEAGSEDQVSHQLVLRRLLDAQPRIIAAITAIIGAIPLDYEPRELIPAEAVAAILGRS